MSCPSDETIARYVDGDLESAAWAALREHVDACERCRARVVEAMADAAPPTRKADPLDVGSVLVGKYRVLSILGAGGMGVVVSAMHEELHQKVAIKVLQEDSLDDADSVKRFLREGRAAARLRSDHAVRIYDVGRLPGGAPFLVMEHLDGRDLASLQRERALEIDEAVGYVVQAIEAISEAHAQGLIHRDIKPANLFLATMSNGEKRVKVLDFGLAKEIGLGKSATDSALTTEHSFLGSPMFMSPEQIRDPRNVDRRTDIWSLGTTLWQLVTGETPFDKGSVQRTLAEVVTKRLPPASSVRPGVPPHIDEAIARCMHKDPEGRFATVEDLAAALADPRRRATGSKLSVSETTANPETSRLPDTAKKALRRTDPMPPQPIVRSLPAVVPPTPQSAPTFAKTQPPPEAPPAKSGLRLALAIVAALALVAIVALGVTQFLPRATRETTAAGSAAPTPAPSASASSSATAVTAAATTRAEPPASAPAASASASASTSTSPSPSTKIAPSATARRTAPSASAKDPYDR